MSFTVVGDPHCKPDNLDKINELFDMVERYEQDVIWLGDFLDTKEIIRGRCLNLLLDRFTSSKLKHYVIIGNHDYFNLDCQDHSLRVFQHLPNVEIVDEVVRIASMVYGIPYVHDPKILKKMLDAIPDGATILGHFEMKGFDFGNGFICEEGTKTSSFKRFKRVISGHFHKFQEKGNFMYLGTPMSHSFGESNQDKYIGSLSDKGFELIETMFPKHMTYELESQEHANLLPTLKKSKDYIRVIVKKKLELDKNLYPNIKFIDRIEDNEAPQYVVSDTEPNEVKFQKWARKHKKLSDTTVQIGVDILKGVHEQGI